MKTKFYSIRTLFFTLLCLFGFAEAINAQTIQLDVENFSTGSNGTSASAGHILEYTITINSGNDPLNGSPIGNIPAGTVYQSGSTVVDGAPVADVNNTMPYVNGMFISRPANTTYTIKFHVIVTANIGTIRNIAVLQLASAPPIQSDPKVTLIITENSCGKIYTLTTKTASGTDFNPRPPRTPIILPYQYISTISVDASNPNTEDIYDGPTGACMEAPTFGNPPTTLPAGSILVDGTAMAFYPHFYRIYFVNRSVGGVPGDLCYIELFDPVANTAVAYRHTNTKLFQNLTSEITRMTFDARGTGYALTENGQQFISFTIGINTTNAPAINSPVTLTPDPGNTHDFFAETGGDICSDGSGKLYFIPSSGNVYVIDPAINVVTYIGTITGLPAGESRAVALDGAGNFYISGFYQGIYKVALSTLTATKVNGVSAWATTDFASCAAPITLARVGANTTGTTPAVPRVNAEVFATIQPNPFHNELNLQVQLNTTEQVRVQLIDFFGRTVYTTSEKMSAGVNSLRLPVPANLGAGIYVVELWTGDKRLLQKKIVKQ